MDALDGGSLAVRRRLVPRGRRDVLRGHLCPASAGHGRRVGGAQSPASRRPAAAGAAERAHRRSWHAGSTHFCRQRGVPLHVQQFASILYLEFDETIKFGSLLYFHLREKGVHLWEGRPFFLSTAHTEADVAAVLRAFEESIVEMQRGGFLPEPRRISAWKPSRSPWLRHARWKTAPAPAVAAKVFAPAPRKAMQFSLYYFGSYPAAYDPQQIRARARGSEVRRYAWLHRGLAAGAAFPQCRRLFAEPLGGRRGPRARDHADCTCAAAASSCRCIIPCAWRRNGRWSITSRRAASASRSPPAGIPNDFVLAPGEFCDSARELCSEGLRTIQQLWRGETVTLRTRPGERLRREAAPAAEAAGTAGLAHLHPPRFLRQSGRDGRQRARLPDESER